jgi:NDP-sugar pyrophosphorylase family protein
MARQAVILAGGKGSRLGPYTTVLPKPLLPVGDRAILDIVVHQLRDFGFTDVTLAVGYLAHLVRAVMGDGSNHGVRIEYHEEETPLGTVGALATIDHTDGPLLAMNGDVLTALDYAQLVDIHNQQGNLLTIASHRRIVRTDYGVLHVDEAQGDTPRVAGFEEKPEIPYVVSMGIYVLEPRAIDYIQPGEYLDLPDLVLRLLDAREAVGSYLYDGYWLDIGRHEDYERAIVEFEQLRPMFLSDAAPPASPATVPAPGAPGA